MAQSTDLDTIEAQRLVACDDGPDITWHERQEAIWGLLDEGGHLPALVAEVRHLRGAPAAMAPQFSDDELAIIRDTCIVQAVGRKSKGTALSLRFARAYEDIGFKADAALKARGSHHNVDVADEAADDE